MEGDWNISRMSSKKETIAVCTDIRIVDLAADWLVVEKPAPLIVHPTSEKPEPTLLGEVRSWLARNGEESGTLSILNRLDRETSGLVLMSRTRLAARQFGKAMERREIHKEYLALVSDWPGWDERVVAEPILRQGDVHESRIWIKQAVHPEGRPSVTHFEVIRRLENRLGRFSIVRAMPETGRTHQIRVHCSHMNHPVVGDPTYSRCRKLPIDLPGQALHAFQLGLEHPINFERMLFEAPMPPVMEKLLGVLRRRNASGQC